MTKNQKIGIGAGVVIVIFLIIGFMAYQNKQTQEIIKELTGIAIKGSNNNSGNSSGTSEETIISPTPAPDNDTGDNVAKDPQNATYTIEGRQVSLNNGESADGTTTMFDTPTVGDLNGDGTNDAGVILVVTGGSGTFYYAAVALNNTSTYTYEGTNAIILGDRIAPQSKDIQNETYTVNFADRAEGEPMTADPSVGVTKNFKVNGATLSEVN
jgi:hypothetical protein